MNILDVLIKLRNDLKTWTINNILALKGYIDTLINNTNDSIEEVRKEIPQKISELENDNEFVDKNYVDTEIDSKVFSGDYNDLENKPVIPTADELLSDEQKTQISTAYNHSQAEHAPSDAQKNSDITKEEIEAKLVGEINSHTHALTYEEILNAPDIVEDESGNLNLVDETGNIIVTIDSNGIHSTNIVADGSIASTSANINNISTNSLEIDGVNILTTVDNKINNMLDGKALKYLTTAEFEELSSEEKNRDDIVYQITDAKLSFEDIDDVPDFATKEYVDQRGFSGDYNDLADKPVNVLDGFTTPVNLKELLQTEMYGAYIIDGFFSYSGGSNAAFAPSKYFVRTEPGVESIVGTVYFDDMYIVYDANWNYTVCSYVTNTRIDEIETQLNNKANKSDVDSKLDTKCDKISDGDLDEILTEVFDEE